MAPSAIVALCLLALASAAPQSLQGLQCATTCEPTRQATVGEVGKTYSFSYNVKSTVNTAGVNEAVTQGGLTGTVDISRINACELAIKFTSANEADKVNKYPLMVSIIGDGQFEKVCAHPEDDSESVNIKKGIASAVQYSLPSFTPIDKILVSERSVLGTCPTTYSILNNGESVTVTKEVVHSDCQGHVYSQSEIPSILSKSPMPLQVSKSVCTQVYSATKAPQTFTCTDTKVVRPAYGSYKYVQATQESTLQFVSESTDMSVVSSIQDTQLLPKKLSQDHSMPAKTPELVGKLDALLSNVCGMIQGQGHQEMAMVVNKVFEMLKHIPDDAFVTILTKIRAGDYCADYSKLEALFMDAIAFIGEPGALKVIAQEVSAGRVTGGRTALYTAALHLLSKPTVNHVAALVPIAAMEDPSSTFIMAAASVVNKHCKLVADCEKIPAVKNILTLLTDKLATQCTPEVSNNKPITVLTTLKAIGNIRYWAPEHAEKVIMCAKTEGVEMNVRVAATLALRGASCKIPVKNALKAIVLDQAMNTEVRFGSYIAAIKCADEADLKEIITKISADSNKQVHSFVLSHLNNLKETNWPLKAPLQKLLGNMNIPTNYESNIFKYSKNIEMSYNTPILGVGAAVESNIIFAPESLLPRLVGLGLDMNLLGSFVNIGEVGARVEGLDPIMKEAFGPESYLYKTPLSEIFKDTSLFIKQNGATIFNKLEKLIKEGGSADIKSIIQSVLEFLKANDIKLPKADLYAKLMGQEVAFLSLAGPMQKVNIHAVIETIKSVIVDALVATKDLNVNTARAAHLYLDYAIPTIQGIPLKIKLVSTAVTGIQIQSKIDTAANQDALLKVIPSLSIAIVGHIGYGTIMKHGLKMTNSIYSTNGLALNANLKDGQDLELKFELPEKMELLNVKTEVYQMTGNNLMDEERIYPSNIKDVRIATELCSAIAEPMTGLHVCFNMNIPDVTKSNSLPLGLPAQFVIYLKKADADMKGYRVTANIKNKADKKVLKMVAGTYGSAASAESSMKLIYAKNANTYQAVAEIKSIWLTTSFDASFTNDIELKSLQILANNQIKTYTPVAMGCKFDAIIVAPNVYQVTGFAGLTNALTEAHKFLTVKLAHALNGEIINADLLVNVEASILPMTLGFGIDIPSKAPWFTVIRKIELEATPGQAVVKALVVRKAPGQYQHTCAILYGGANVLNIDATHTITGVVLQNFNVITEASVKVLNREIGTTFTYKHENAVIATIWELRNAGAKVFNINVKHSMDSKLYTTTVEIGLPTLTKTFKFNNVINVVEFLNYNVVTDMFMDNTALLHIEGPIALQFSKALIKQNMDLKISGAFEGTIKVMHAALLSLEKIQYTLDMRHSATPITLIDILLDMTNAAEINAKAVIHVPILVKAEYAAAATAGLVHITMNQIILPTTLLARRFKGYAEFNLETQKLKADFYWDAEKDINKKLAFTAGFNADSSLGKILIQGDLAVTTLIYGFKLEAIMASPLEWFAGTNGLELAITAPSNKVVIAKTLCTVEVAESLVIFKPLVAVHTLDENIYELAGSLAIKQLPTLLTFDISSEFTLTIPQIQKIAIATNFLHEDKDGACATVFKTGITGLNEPIALEITHGGSGEKYTTLFKIQQGATVGSVATNVALISGFKAFDITVDASLPFTVVKAVSLRTTKTADGALTWTISLNQAILAKLNYVMTSWAAHTLSLEFPSRTIEVVVGLAGNEITMKVFPEKNVSPKELKAIIRATQKVGSTHIECFVTAPSLEKEIKIAAEFFVPDPTMDKIINVDIQFPAAEFKALVNAVVEELKKIYEDLVKDGVFPDMVVVYNKLMAVLKDLPNLLKTLKVEITKILTKYWKIVRKWGMKMWKNYEADVTALVNAVKTEILRYWEVLKIEVPILFKDFLAKVQKTELWKMLSGLVNQVIEKYPALFNILLDFYNKVIWTAVTEIKAVVNKFINLPSFGIDAVWTLLKTELPALITNLKITLMNTELVAVIIEKVTQLKVMFPNVTAAVVDLWYGFIMPVANDIIQVIWKVMTIDIASIKKLIEHLLKEIPVVVNAIVTRFMDISVVKTLIAMAGQFIEANPQIKAVLETFIGVIQNILMELKVDVLKVVGKLMDIPLIKKIVLWVQDVILTQNINMDFSIETATAICHSFVTNALGVTYSIAGDRIFAVVPLPISVATLKYTWTSVTADLPAFIAELIKSLTTFIEKLPVLVLKLKEDAILLVKFVAEQIPAILKTLETQLPIVINELIVTLNHFTAFLMNTNVVKFIIAKIDEVIKMYPAQFNLIKEYLETSLRYVVEWTTLAYTKLMKIPLVKKIVEFIWDLINRKALYATMTSTWSSVSASVSSYSSVVASNLPAFIKLHTPSVVSSWIAPLIQ